MTAGDAIVNGQPQTSLPMEDADDLTDLLNRLHDEARCQAPSLTTSCAPLGNDER